MPYTDAAGDTVDDTPAGQLEDRAAGLLFGARILTDAGLLFGAADLVDAADAVVEVAARLLTEAHAERLVVEIRRQDLASRQLERLLAEAESVEDAREYVPA